jgi:hypothetical protein
MKIVIGEYRLISADSGFRVDKYSVTKKGDDAWRALGYYGYIEHALEALNEAMISDKANGGIGDAIRVFKECRAEIVKAITPV